MILELPRFDVGLCIDFKSVVVFQRRSCLDFGAALGLFVGSCVDSKNIILDCS